VEEPVPGLSFRIALPSFCATARNDALVGAHFGRADQGPKMDPRTVSRLVERMAVGEGEHEPAHLGWVTAYPARATRRVRAARAFIALSSRRTSLVERLGTGKTICRELDPVIQRYNFDA
jgi:hypothetical protein